MRVAARTSPHETDIARVSQGPRGFVIRADARVMGHVSHGNRGGWHWYTFASAGVAWRNSRAEGLTYETREAARDAYIKRELTKVPT